MGLDEPARSLDRAQSAELIRSWGRRVVDRWQAMSIDDGASRAVTKEAQLFVNQGTTGDVRRW